MSAAPTPASSILFARGVIARLSIWPVLTIAVQSGWGGSSGVEKRTWLASTIVDLFETEHETPDEEYVEELLGQVLNDEFDVNVEDGSLKVTARDIVAIWEETKIGKEELVKKFEVLEGKAKGVKITAQIDEANSTQDEEGEWEDDDENGSDDEMDDPAPTLIQPKERPEPVVDEDGFTLVQGKGRR